jgi:phosphatidylserine synthase 2
MHPILKIYLKSHRRFGGLCSILSIVCSNFLTGFFLINNLWIPPQNNLNLYRLLVWFLLGSLAFRECYTDIITWGKPERKENPITGKMRYLKKTTLMNKFLKTFLLSNLRHKYSTICRWLCCGITFIEFLVSWKFRNGAGNMVMDAEWPIYITVPWITTIILFASTYIYLRFKKDRTTIYGNLGDNSIENKKSK